MEGRVRGGEESSESEVRDERDEEDDVDDDDDDRECVGEGDREGGGEGAPTKVSVGIGPKRACWAGVK